jgi:antitoxin VapB
MDVAKVFNRGHSQMVRLPKEFRFNSDEVYISKHNGKVILSEKDKREDFKKALDGIFGCCPDLDVGRDAINDEPREVNL